MLSKGVSPMVATIILLSLVFAVSVILMAMVYGWPRPVAPYGGEFTIENLIVGSENLIVTHTGGPGVDRAFDVDDLLVTWDKLELRVNGISENMKCLYATSRGTPVVDYPADNSENDILIALGDVFVINVSGAIGRPLEAWDGVALYYVPGYQTIFRASVPPA